MNTNTPEPLDQYDNALIQYLKKSGNNNAPRLEDVRAIWGWRCGMTPECVRLTDIAESLYVLCEQLDLLGPSLSTFPGGRGGFGVIADAAPDRGWTLGLLGAAWVGDSPDNHYWFRIIAVLCSRLRLSEVAKLPGYNHNAKFGPFGGGGAVVS